MAQHKIFISYAWGGESERIAEAIEKAFLEKELDIIRDKKNLGYKGLIKKFMRDLGAGAAIITVISDKYLKSKNCMFELLEIAEHKDFYDRVFPIVLEDAKIYDSEERIDYLEYWEKKIEKLDKSIRHLKSSANTQGIREDIDHYTKIRAMIAGLVDSLSYMNTLTVDIHEDTGYEALYSAIIEKLNERPSQEITKPVESVSIPKTPSQQSPFSKELTVLIRIPKEDIIGRKKDLKYLRKRLVEDKKLSLINGMGGIGKTTLAAVYVEEYYDEYDHVAWLTIESSLEEAILANRDLLTNLKLQNIPSNELPSECLNQLRTLSSTQPGLLVLDNATERLGRLYDHLPKAPNWHVLVTSREKIEPFSMIELEFLTEAEAIQLFQKYNDKFTEEDIQNIVNEVELHTLAIEILAKSASKNRWSADTVKKAIIENAKAGIATSHSRYEIIDRIKAYLIQIFKISNLDAQQEYLLKQFTALPNQWITYEQLGNLLQAEKLTWKDEFSGTLEELYEKGYIQKDAATDSFKMHPVLVEAFSPQLETTIDDLKLLLYSVGNKLFLNETKDSPIDRFPFIPFGEALLKKVSTDTSIEIAALQNHLALRYKDIGQAERARDLLEKSVKFSLHYYGETHSVVADRKSNLGTIYHDLGNLKAARSFLEEALEANKENFDEKHPDVARIQSNLGLVYKDLGDYSKAKDLLEKSLRSDIENFGEKHPEVAIRKSNLANLYYDIGEYKQARDLAKEVLALAQKNYGDKHPKVAFRQTNLAGIYIRLGENEKALKLLESALESDIENFGNYHPRIVGLKTTLGIVYKRMGKNEMAQDLSEEAVALAKKTFGEKHPKLAQVQYNLALIYRDLDDNEKARNLMEEALDIEKEIFRENHPDVAVTQTTLALIYIKLKDYKKARELLLSAYQIFVGKFGENHFRTKEVKSYLQQIEGK